jgi:hypothetical protein
VGVRVSACPTKDCCWDGVQMNRFVESSRRWEMNGSRNGLHEEFGGPSSLVNSIPENILLK